MKKNLKTDEKHKGKKPGQLPPPQEKMLHHILAAKKICLIHVMYL
jgi:hypothetical protein